MHPQTGITILKILQKRVPLQPTAVTTVDGETIEVRSIQGPGRDLGDEFDYIMVNFGEPDDAFLRTCEVTRIIDPTDGKVIFDAETSDKRMPAEQIRPFGNRPS